MRPGSTAYGMVASTLGRSSEWNKCLQVIQDMKSCLLAAVFFVFFFIKKKSQLLIIKKNKEFGAFCWKEWMKLGLKKSIGGRGVCQQSFFLFFLEGNNDFF